ncbi:MAG: c-type cytochrome [Planctomycetia bacterium]|nr:c-type cytochrome [Planctomycetia bacterium]
MLVSRMLRPIVAGMTLAALGAAFALMQVQTAFAAGPVVAPYERLAADPKAGQAALGRLLLGELNCVACHEPPAAAAAHLAPKAAPILDQVGGRVRPEALRAMIADPQKAKPGTTMPDVLSSLPADEKQAAVESLVHFLASTGAVRDTAPDHAAAGRGEALFHSVGCVGCHDSRRTDAKPLATSVPLGQPDKKYTIASLTAFLLDPLKVRPSGRMPGLGLAPEDASNLAHYFLRDIQVPSNVAFKYYEGSWDKLPDFSKLEPKASGQTTSIDVAVAQRRDQIGLRFEGFVQIPQEGQYRFFLGSDDGSRLVLGGKLLIDNDNVHAHTEKQTIIKLAAGPHAVVVDFFEQAGEESVRAEIEGPNLPRQPLASLMTTTREPPKPPSAFDVQPDLAAKGRKLFATLGCASCHEFNEKGSRIMSERAAPPLHSLKAGGGCLSTSEPAGGVRQKTPDFHLTNAQRSAMTAAISSLPKLPSPTTAQRVHDALVAFNCYACHVRDKIGGIEEARNALFTTATPEMGDEGRIPPALDGVGGKLAPAALRYILANGAKDRPYMHARMPRFGLTNVGQLVEGFEELDLDRAADPPPIAIDAPVAKIKADGRLLVGSQGLSCIKCHNFAGRQSAGINTMDLVQIAQRLRPEWFVRYMADPQAYRPGTRMPSAWPNGKSFFPGVLEGDTQQQIWAMWTYLSDGRKAATPLGLEQEAIELFVVDEAVVYRNFIEGAGARAIAVGYPQRVNLAFDAEDLRLALIWQGAFIDASLHWSGRGAGFIGPLGDNVQAFQKGVAFAVLPDAKATWPAQSARTLGCQFRGYRLEKDRRPVFRYDVAGVEVTDDFQGENDEQGTGYFRRVVSLKGKPQGALYYRAAVHSKIETVDGWYVVGDAVRMRFEGGGKPIVRKQGDNQELLLPIDLAAGETKFVHEYRW